MTVGNTPIIAPAIITSLFIIFVYVQRTQIYNDALTGLNNRKRLFFMLEAKIPQVDKEHPMLLYILDANRFKQINDKYAHAEGDNALVSIAECMMQLAGEYHIFVARYGGDEFVVYLKNLTGEMARTYMETFQRMISQLTLPTGEAVELSASAGGAAFPEQGEDVMSLCKSADMALSLIHI